MLSALVMEGGKQTVTAFAESKRAAGFCLFLVVLGLKLMTLHMVVKSLLGSQYVWVHHHHPEYSGSSPLPIDGTSL